MEYLNKLYIGRLNRRTYLAGGLIIGVAYWLISYVVRLLGSNIIFNLVYLVLLILVVAFVFSLSARRFHDLGKSGWLSLLMLIPVVNFFVWLFLLLAPGKSGSNLYGTQPADAFELEKIYQYK